MIEQPQGQPSFVKQLLPTSLEMLPPILVDSLRAFCAGADEVEAGYVCLVRVDRADAERVERLEVAVKLKRSVAGPEDLRGASVVLAGELAKTHPNLARDVGLIVLADRAVLAWTKLGQRVYP
jgi:hypothetical protein